MIVFDNFKIFQSVATLILALLTRYIITLSLHKIQIKFGFQKARILVINKIVSIIVYSLIIVFISFIWGVERQELLLFISSFLTVLGIAFFAKWSILSNISAGIIIFLNYPVKIGDTISIIELDNTITGKIMNVNAFFITLKTDENELITVPNSVILDKPIKYKNN
ncbi:mechanosensitive ion channel domain-containing protein [Polaribacter sp. HL-MS24]|uniref:mechanosensitive ion channel domain-containing protein n=1 Tax=Polaribacter sp. HL-MS24 TaxID=3077735 RepID=UPI0029344012|nr:mechanosensitive ion channel domain-containing protein [Polaribacter sp. HL-MS24]WOC39261.1 mechanosensitive ion channel [Polaribacter sp. HL-MS24]